MLLNVVRHTIEKRARGLVFSPAHALSAPKNIELRAFPKVGSKLPERRSYTHQSSTFKETIDVRLAGSSSGSVVNERTALGVPAVMACTNLLSNMVAKLPLELLVDNGKGPVQIVNHAGLDAISRSSDLHTRFELIQLMMVGKCLGGNGYARIYRDSKYLPETVEWIAPCDIEPHIVSRNGRKSVIYRHLGQTLTKPDVIHIRTITRDGAKGISPIQQLRESIGTSMAQTEAAGRLMKNGTTFPGFLVPTTALSIEKIKDLREEWEKNYSGVANVGRPPILNGNLDFKQTNGLSMTDAQFLESRRFELQEIARHMGIPSFLIGDATASTSWGTGIQEQTLGFLNFSLDPHLTSFEQILNHALLTSDEQAAGYYFKFDRDELASVSRQDTAAYFQAMRGIGVYSINDIRRKLDETILTPEQGGDDYLLPFNNTGGAAQAKEQPQKQSA